MTDTMTNSFDLLIRATLGDKSAIDELYGHHDAPTAEAPITCDVCHVEITDTNCADSTDKLCADCADESGAPYCGKCGQSCYVRMFHEYDVNAHWIETNCCKAETIYRNKGLTIEIEDVSDYLED